jgi:hypothetical protein
VRRLGRHILSALAVFSLVLFVATAALWARSYTCTDGVVLYRTFKYSICSERGNIYLRRSWTIVRQYFADSGHGTEPYISPYSSHFVFEWRLNRDWSRDSKGTTGPIDVEWPEQRIRVPDWIIAVFLAVLPVTRFALFPLLRCRRSGQGLCATCGYDLRATPNRCPECGTPAKGFA